MTVLVFHTDVWEIVVILPAESNRDYCGDNQNIVARTRGEIQSSHRVQFSHTKKRVDRDAGDPAPFLSFLHLWTCVAETVEKRRLDHPRGLPRGWTGRSVPQSRQHKFTNQGMTGTERDSVSLSDMRHWNVPFGSTIGTIKNCLRYFMTTQHPKWTDPFLNEIEDEHEKLVNRRLQNTKNCECPWCRRNVLYLSAFVSSWVW